MFWFGKRDRAVAIVLHNDQLLVINRLKRGTQYYSLPGGGIKRNEDPGHAAAREAYEETAVVVKPIKLLYEHEYGKSGTHYYFLCKYQHGRPRRGIGDERFRHVKGINEYHPQWLPITQLDTDNVLPKDAVRLIIKDLKNGFTETVQKATYNRARR